MHNFLSLLGFFARNWKGFLLSAFIASLTIFSSVALLGTSSFLIAAAALHPSIAELQMAIVGVRFFGISRGVFRYAERYYSHTITFKLLARLRVWFYRSIEPAAPAIFGQYHSGEIFSRIIADIEILENFFIRAVSPMLVYLLVFVGISAWLLGYSSLMAISLVVVFFIAGLLLPLIIQALSQKPVQLLSETGTQLKIQVIDVLQGSSEVRIFGLAAQLTAQFERIDHSLSLSQKRLGLIEAAQDSIFQFLTGCGWLMILLVGAQSVDKGALEGVLLASLVMASMASFEGLQPMPLAGRYLREALAAWKRLTAFLCKETGQENLAEPIWETGSRVDMQDVSLRYLAEEPERLQDISFKLKAGEKLAIVGTNGSGKTSLVNLLLGFWQPSSGRIRINEQNLSELDLYVWRDQISVIGQGTYLFNASLRENLLIAQPGASQEELDSVLQKARLQDFVGSLPDGLETFVGELGQMISGGERQRVAIARALLKNAPVWILDEPLVNLDSITAGEIWQNLETLMEEKTVLLISHRLQEICDFDRIILLEKGRITAQGGYQELNRDSEIFKNYWQSQSDLLRMD